jgi:hypothetical protein
MGPVEELLRKAYKQIEQPERWTKEWYAKNADGNRVAENAPGACQWCLVGSLNVQFPNCMVDDGRRKAFDLINQQIADRYQPSVRVTHLWNDDPTTTHDQVLEVLTAAADEAHRQEL